MANMNILTLTRIVSGGQTGADRAALDWAIARGVAHGGWCPRGRKAEDGDIPPAYVLKETPTSAYAERTEWNVRDSDATVIFSSSRHLDGGSALTARCARRMNKPLLHLCTSSGAEVAAKKLRAFVDGHAVRVLNIAGPRASRDPRVAGFVAEVLDRAFR